MKTRMMLGVVGLTAVLSACGGPTVTGGGTPVDPNLSTLNGQVLGLTRGAATLELLVDNYRDKSASNPLVAQATVSAGGAFSLPLPGAATLNPYLLPVSATITTNGCSGELTSSTPGAKSFEFDLLDLTRNGSYVDSVENVSAVDQSAGTTQKVMLTGRRWAYLNQATTMGGSYTCQGTDSTSGDSITSTYRWNSAVKAGWNVQTVVTVLTTEQGSGVITADTSVTTSADMPTTWTSASGLTTLSVNGNALRSAAQLVRFHR